MRLDALTLISVYRVYLSVNYYREPSKVWDHLSGDKEKLGHTSEEGGHDHVIATIN